MLSLLLLATTPPADEFGSGEIVTIIVAIVAATGASLVTALASRPKVSAEARAAAAGGQVAISADARAWAETFQKRAEASDAKAAAAEQKAEDADNRADAAERAAAECTRAVEILDLKVNEALSYMVTLQGQIRLLGGQPAEPPSILRPPL